MAKMASQAKRRVRNTRKGRRQFTIQDLNAWEQAYGHQLSAPRRFRKILPYVISITAFTQLLFASLPLSILVFVLAALWCSASILPKETYIAYTRASYSERNRTINLLSQALSGGDTTLFSALKQTLPAMNGELKHEFQILTGLLARSARNDELHDWFVNEISKYRDDVIFGQYLEQLETMNEEGTYTVDTFLNLAHYHNDLYQKQSLYIRAREEQRNAIFTVVVVVFVVILVIAMLVQGWGTWVKLFAHSMVGLFVGSAFVTIYAYIIVKFIKYYYDESITTFGKDSQMHSIIRRSRSKADREIQREAAKQMVTLTLSPADRIAPKKRQHSSKQASFNKKSHKRTKSIGFGK